MIDVRISRSGLERFGSNGTPAEIVLEFGYLINQYCSAIKKMLPAGPPRRAKGFRGPYRAGQPGLETGRGRGGVLREQEGGRVKVYIAGKITGNENYKAEFAEAEKKLRALGHIPLNPAVLPEGLEKADYMRICLAMLDSADAIALMLNWTGSPGANIELSLAMYTGKKQIDLWTIPNL